MGGRQGGRVSRDHESSLNKVSLPFTEGSGRRVGEKASRLRKGVPDMQLENCEHRILKRCDMLKRIQKDITH